MIEDLIMQGGQSASLVIFSYAARAGDQARAVARP